MQKIIIDFGGFYGSLHEAFIEDAMWADDDGGESLTDSDENIDWDAVKDTYSEAYLDKLCEFTAFELGMESIHINYKGLDSPSYYNFTTDVIIGEISDEHSFELMNAIHNGFLSCLLGSERCLFLFSGHSIFLSCLLGSEPVIIPYKIE